MKLEGNISINFSDLFHTKMSYKTFINAYKLFRYLIFNDINNYEIISI
jgi:hypothetical protein